MDSTHEKISTSHLKILVPSVGTEAQITYNKETIQPNNKAPRETLLFGSFVCFVMTVPAERPKILLMYDLPGTLFSEKLIFHFQHNVLKYTKDVPVELKDALDHESFEKARVYQLDRSSFGFYSGAYSQLETTVR